MAKNSEPLRPPFETVAWTGSAVRILDQRSLPGSVVHRDLETVEGVVEAIRSLAVRGAPAIGIAAAMGVALAAARAAGRPRGEFDARVRKAGSLLCASRPTAVNLPWAVGRMLALLDASPASGTAEMAAVLAREAQTVLDEDRLMCARIGEHGASLLGTSTVVLTHCNAGALATGGIGTALAPLFVLRSRGRTLRVYVGETRPLWQGARLTAWELRQAGIETILLPDTAAAWTLRTRSIDCVIVGADRICRNGDVANKIGSYGLALAAGACGIPFYVAAPSSTVDLALASGDGIPIEERSGDEVTRPLGIQLAPEGVGVFNPAFDVVPNGLVTAIVTEDGIARPPFGEALAGAVRSRNAAGGRRP